jgi:hypothetical protein
MVIDLTEESVSRFLIFVFSQCCSGIITGATIKASVDLSLVVLPAGILQGAVVALHRVVKDVRYMEFAV